MSSGSEPEEQGLSVEEQRETLGLLFLGVVLVVLCLGEAAGWVRDGFGRLWQGTGAPANPEGTRSEPNPPRLPWHFTRTI